MCVYIYTHERQQKDVASTYQLQALTLLSFSFFLFSFFFFSLSLKNTLRLHLRRS